MIDALTKDAAGNIEFTLQGVDYRIFMAGISVFEQQEVTGIVTDASDDEGEFNPFSSAGVLATRKILAYAQVKQGDSFTTLDEDVQRSHFNREFGEQFKGETCVLPGGVSVELSTVLHLGFLALVVQALVQDEDWNPLVEKEKVAKKKQSAQQPKEKSTKPSSPVTLQKTLKRSRQK